MRRKLNRARAAAADLLFAHCFDLLLLVMCVAQWVSAATLALILGGLSMPVWVHVMGVSGVYFLNRIVLGFRPLQLGHLARLPLRIYSAAAFVSLFCLLFLLVSGVLWLIAGQIAGAWSIRTGVLLQGGTLGSFDPRGAFGAFTLFGMLGIGLLFGYGYTFGRRQIRVERVRVAVACLQPQARSIRLAHISDLHIGQNLTVEEVEGLVATVNAEAPDLVCISGDIADSEGADLETFLPILGRLRARHGVFAVPGNHDHYAGIDHFARQLGRFTDFRLLRDEAVTVELEGARLHVVGLDDRGQDPIRGARRDPKLLGLLEGAPADAPVFLLAHRPDVFLHASEAGVAVMLAGHTHGGQLSLPWFGGRHISVLTLFAEFDRGLYERNGSYLYVNMGFGVTGEPIRLFTPREITFLEVVGTQPA